MIHPDDTFTPIYRSDMISLTLVEQHGDKFERIGTIAGKAMAGKALLGFVTNAPKDEV